ncbi:MAG: hypothetical protein JSR79_02705 [Proteobacteria bacterium]|nr:hypothetical protein [Pseudomonadota bacterium]
MIALALIAAAALQPQLQPLSFLAGHCWQGEVAPGRTDRHCFVVLTDGAIRDRHIVVERGKRVIAGESVYRWDARLGAIGFTYRDSFGGQMTGLVRSRGNLLGFAGRYTAGSGQRFGITSRWTRVDASSYRTDTRSADVPQVNGSTVYRRLD